MYVKYIIACFAYIYIYIYIYILIQINIINTLCNTQLPLITNCNLQLIIIKIKVFNTYKLSFNVSDQRCICVIGFISVIHTLIISKLVNYLQKHNTLQLFTLYNTLRI